MLMLEAPAFLLLLPVLVGISLFWRKAGRQKDFTEMFYISPLAGMHVRHPLASLIDNKDSPSTRLRMDYSVISWLAITCLVIALARPVLVGNEIPEPPRQRDITLIVDTSVSMVLEDYELEGKPIDRMSFLKGFLDRFITALAGERLSVIVFGDTAHTLLPLTDDTRLAREMAARIEATMAGRFKAVSEAIALAVRQASRDKKRKRVLILFTDADESTDGFSPQAAARLAEEHGLPLYTIAIGGSGSSNLSSGSELLYRPANISLMQTLAATTGADSYQAADLDSMRSAVEAIDRRESYAADLPPRREIRPLYPVLLILSLGSLMLYQFLPLFRRRRS